MECMQQNPATNFIDMRDIKKKKLFVSKDISPLHMQRLNELDVLIVGFATARGSFPWKPISVGKKDQRAVPS